MAEWGTTTWEQRRDMRLAALAARLRAHFLRQAAQGARGQSRQVHDLIAWEQEIRPRFNGPDQPGPPGE